MRHSTSRTCRRLRQSHATACLEGEQVAWPAASPASDFWRRLRPEPFVCRRTAARPARNRSAPAPPRKGLHPHKRPSDSAYPASGAQAAPVPVAPPRPKPPDWPVNDQPTDAAVVWNSQGLRIEASNSSLEQILTDVSTATGVKVQGLGTDRAHLWRLRPRQGARRAGAAARRLRLQRVDDRRPGPGNAARDPVERSSQAGDAPAAGHNQTASNDENSEAEDQPAEPQPPPPTIRNGFTPGAPPRTPQQIMQEMQQRQQMQQQNSPQ